MLDTGSSGSLMNTHAPRSKQHATLICCPWFLTGLIVAAVLLNSRMRSRMVRQHILSAGTETPYALKRGRFSSNNGSAMVASHLESEVFLLHPHKCFPGVTSEFFTNLTGASRPSANSYDHLLKIIPKMSEETVLDPACGGGILSTASGVHTQANRIHWCGSFSA